MDISNDRANMGVVEYAEFLLSGLLAYIRTYEYHGIKSNAMAQGDLVDSEVFNELRTKAIQLTGYSKPVKECGRYDKEDVINQTKGICEVLRAMTLANNDIRRNKEWQAQLMKNL